MDWAKIMMSRNKIRETGEIFGLLALKHEKGFWQHFLTCYKMIYDGMKWIIPERLLKIF